MNELLVSHEKGPNSVGPAGNRASQRPHLSHFVYLLKITALFWVCSLTFIHGIVARYMFKPPICFAFVTMGSTAVVYMHWSKLHVCKQRLGSYLWCIYTYTEGPRPLNNNACGCGVDLLGQPPYLCRQGEPSIF